MARYQERSTLEREEVLCLTIYTRLMSERPQSSEKGKGTKGKSGPVVTAMTAMARSRNRSGSLRARSEDNSDGSSADRSTVRAATRARKKARTARGQEAAAAARTREPDEAEENLITEESVVQDGEGRANNSNNGNNNESNNNNGEEDDDISLGDDEDEGNNENTLNGAAARSEAAGSGETSRMSGSGSGVSAPAVGVPVPGEVNERRLSNQSTNSALTDRTNSNASSISSTLAVASIPSVSSVYLDEMKGQLLASQLSAWFFKRVKFVNDVTFEKDELGLLARSFTCLGLVSKMQQDLMKPQLIKYWKHRVGRMRDYFIQNVQKAVLKMGK